MDAHFVTLNVSKFCLHAIRQKFVLYNLILPLECIHDIAQTIVKTKGSKAFF